MSECEEINVLLKLEDYTNAAMVQIHDPDKPRIGYWSKDGAIGDNALEVVRQAGWRVAWISTRAGEQVGMSRNRVAYMEIVKDDRAIVSQRSVETAALELQYLIDKTEHDRPDPLTDVVFQARDELAENLGWEDFR